MTIRVGIVTEPIDTAAILREVEFPGHGASLLFVGLVRETNDGKAVTGMDYSAYDGMAVKEMEAIATEVAAKFSGSFVVIVHRTGSLSIGEASVAIATSHAHRDAAYGANRYVIEQLKVRVPIWKREHYADGNREWVHNAASESPARVTGSAR